ncbi:MAG: Hsp20/alpha crystallin family protein [Acidobacteriota bacterium]|jgi:HSP20 family protein
MFPARRDASTSAPALQNIQSTMNRLFDEALGDFFGPTRSRAMGWAPPVEIYETDSELVLVAELPGVERKDLHISFENGQLTIAGERKGPEQSRNYHRSERFYGSFERTFQFPGSVDGEKIAASLKDGMLEVKIPKKEEAKARQIQVSVG